MPFPDAFVEQSVSPALDTYFIETLEFHHDAFPEPVRLVNQPVDHTLTLEITAPVQPSQVVVWTACQFDIKKPQKGDSGRQSVEITIPNVDRRITAKMDLARAIGGNILCFWRTYVPTSSFPVLDPPPKFQIRNGVISVFEIRLTATFFEFLNDKFPSKLYSNAFAPGLQR